VELDPEPANQYETAVADGDELTVRILPSMSRAPHRPENVRSGKCRAPSAAADRSSAGQDRDARITAIAEALHLLEEGAEMRECTLGAGPTVPVLECSPEKNIGEHSKPSSTSRRQLPQGSL